MALIPGTHLHSHLGVSQVDDVLDDHGPSIHAAISPQSLEHAPLPSRTATDNTTSDFAQIIQRYEHDMLDSASRRPSSALQHVHSWDEVMQAAKLAREKYIADAKGGKGSIRRFFRWTGDHSAILVEWTGVLPNDKYFAILCGGLTVILKAAARRRDRREQILEAFEEIPEIVVKTQRCHALFPHDSMLRDRALALYLDLLHMIEAMIASLVETSMWKHLKDGLKGVHSDKPLDEKIKQSKVSIQALQDQLDYLQASTLVATNDTVSRMDPRLAKVEETTAGAQRLALETRNRTTVIQDSIGDVGRTIEQMQRNVTKQLEETTCVNRQLESSAEGTRHVMALLKGVIDLAEWKSNQIVNQVRGLIEENRPPPTLQWSNSRETLLNLMAVDESAVARDVTFIQRQSQSIEDSEQRQALWLLQAPRFEKWLCSCGSDIILVEGNSTRYGMARYSSMSLVASAMAQELGEQRVSRAIFFFCGLHNSATDDLAGPRGLMRSLIVQILRIADNVCEVHPSSSHLHALAKHDVGALCDLFQQILVRSRFASVLFCVIDGISLFEADRWLEEAQLTVWRLTNIAADPRLNTVFKLLLTSPGTARYVKDPIGIGNRVWIPRDATSTALTSLSQGVHRGASQVVADEDELYNTYEYGCE